MRFCQILQTIADKDNPDYVEEHGPFIAEQNTWLGRGYYFWERFEAIAKWWGNSHYNGEFMVCKASAALQDEELLDLVSDTEQMEYFGKACNALQSKYPDKQITVSYVIEYLRNKGIFPYKAIRAHSINCGEGDKYFRLSFRERQLTNSYLNLMPAIQFCFFDKDCISNYHIIYPDEYVQVV